jgi:tetratricopeptide (TPR) repeat protein
MATSLDRWEGRQLGGGRYRVTAKLGEGGMGCVYRARDANLDCDVVVKVPRPSLLDDPEFAGRFAREVRSLVRLVHPHIVRITDVGECDGVPFAVMQYLPGGSLEQRQPRGRGVPAAALAAWLEPVAEALDYIHKQGYVHRDIKPANILFDDHGSAYVSDFGVAKALTGQAGKSLASLTGTGMVLGTPQYMAPEMLLGHDYDGRVDQYALAVTVYEVVSGRLPFDGQTPAAILLRQVSEPARPLDQAAPSTSAALAAAVARALAREPGQRFATCTAFAGAVLRGLPADAGAPRPAEPEAPPEKVSCPRCGKGYTVPARALHRRLRCAACRETFTPTSAPAGPACPVAPPPETGREVQVGVSTRPLRRAGGTPARPSPPARSVMAAPEGAEEPQPPRTGGARRTWVWVAGGLAALVAAAGIVPVVWQRPAAPPPPGDNAPAAASRSAASPPSAEKAPATASRPEGPSPVAADPAEQALLDQGRARFRAHDYNQAITRYREALGRNASSARAHAGLAEVHVARREYDQALSECAKALDLDPKSAAALVHRGRVEAERGDAALARKDYDAAILLDPDLALGWANRGTLRADEGDLDGGLADCDRAVELASALARARVARAYLRLAAGKTALAGVDADEAVRLDPKDPLAFHVRGLVSLAKNEPGKALTDFGEALQLDSECAAAFLGRGRARLAGGDAEQALADFTEAIRLAPNDAAAYADRGALALGRGDYDRAIDDLDRAVKRKTRDPAVYRNRGKAHAARKEFDLAIADDTDAIKLDPNDVVAHFQRAVAHASKGEVDQAIGDYGGVIRLEPGNVAARLDRAGLYVTSRKELDKAIDDYTAAGRLAPKDHRAFLGRGKVYLEQEAWGEAVKDFSEVIGLSPDCQPAYRHRAEAYFHTRASDKAAYDKALADDNKAVELDPKDPAARNHRGLVHFTKGHDDLAIADYRKAIDLDPKVAVVHYNLGNACLRTNNPDEAIQCFNMALGLSPDPELKSAAEQHRALANRLKQELARPRGTPEQTGPGSTPRAPGDPAARPEPIEQRPPARTATLDSVVTYPGCPADPLRTLGEALKDLADRYGLKITVDDAVFLAEGVEDVRSQPAGRKAIPEMTNVPLQQVLERVLENTSCKVTPTYLARGSRVEITTVRGARGRRAPK